MNFDQTLETMAGEGAEVRVTVEEQGEVVVVGPRGGRDCNGF